MKSKFQFAAIFVTAAITFACATTSTQNKNTEANDFTIKDEDKDQSGAGIADFTLDNLEGRSVSLSDFLGDNVVVINFWSTDCPPCKREMVHLQKLYEKYGENNFVLLSIATDEPETVGLVRPYIKQRGYTFPVLLDGESQVTNQLNPKKDQPLTLVISRSEEIIWTHVGYVPGDEVLLENEILKALKR